MGSLLYHDVPNFEVVFSSRKKFNYCVIIFVINEGDKLKSQLSRMEAVQVSADIIIADGGSTDGSMESEFLISKGVNTLLVKNDSGGLGSQMRIAFSWALQRGYEGVVIIDGNNKDSVRNINDFITLLKEGYDHIQGSRFIDGGKAINTPLSRLFGLKFLHVPLIKLASGFKYTDTTNGFRAYSSSLLSSNRIELFRDLFTGYELHYYMAIQAPRQGYRCIETPVVRKYPKGKAPTKISFFRGNINVFTKLISVCLGRYNIK